MCMLSLNISTTVSPKSCKSNRKAVGCALLVESVSALINVAQPPGDTDSLQMRGNTKSMSTLVTIGARKITLSRSIAASHAGSTCGYECVANAVFRTERQVAPSVPIETTVVWSPFKIPLSHRSAPR